MTFSPLALDSKLARAKVGKIIIDEGRLAPAFIKRHFKDFDLVYVFSKMDPLLLREFHGFDWVFAGVKIVFHSKLRSIDFPEKDLSPEDFCRLSDKRGLISLGQDLFKQSRFYPDPHLHGLGKKIYTEWIKNSMSGRAADAVFVQRNLKGSVIGFVTVKRNKDNFEPVLLKVSDKYQGMGHGRNLMHKFFNYAACANPRFPLVVNAMLQNTQALNFYHSLGLKIREHRHIYHVYPKGFKRF